MLVLHLEELAFGQLHFNHSWLGVCVLVWAFGCAAMVSVLIISESCCFTLLLHLVELAFGRLFFNNT